MKIQEGTVAVVTGAAGGIGRALALGLAAKHCSLALADINATGLDETAMMARDCTSTVTTRLVDVADSGAVERFTSEVIESHGRVHLLINNAGVALGGRIEEVSPQDIAWLFNINFWGMVYGIKCFLPVLKQQPEAHIVNLSSVFGLLAPPGQAAYAASKFAVRGFTDSLRQELAATSAINVSCVYPGGVKTGIASNARYGSMTDAARERVHTFFERNLRLSPDQAAEMILRGVEANKDRILIGRDAYMLDLLARLAPVGSTRLLSRLLWKRVT
jgi:short-subunit dehydrogenase